jgi:hypothetical protein
VRVLKKRDGSFLLASAVLLLLFLFGYFFLFFLFGYFFLFFLFGDFFLLLLFCNLEDLLYLYTYKILKLSDTTHASKGMIKKGTKEKLSKLW